MSGPCSFLLSRQALKQAAPCLHLSGLSSLRMLHTLSVAGNSIRRLSGLDGLVGLKVLNIEGNRIK